MIGNSTEAEDLTQDVFVQVFRKLGSFRGESAFTTWLHRLTVNQVLMHFRKNDGRNEQLTEDGEMPVGIMLDRNRFNRSPVLDRLALDEAIVQLPRGYRMVFLLHDVEGLEHSEIASLLGCSIGTSKSQLHRARMRMRLLLRRRTRHGLAWRTQRTAGGKEYHEAGHHSHCCCPHHVWCKQPSKTYQLHSHFTLVATAY